MGRNWENGKDTGKWEGNRKTGRKLELALTDKDPGVCQDLVDGIPPWSDDVLVLGLLDLHRHSGALFLHLAPDSHHLQTWSVYGVDWLMNETK